MQTMLFFDQAHGGGGGDVACPTQNAVANAYK